MTQQKILLTKLEEHMFKNFILCEGGYLRGHDGNHYRLLDKDFNPVSNVTRKMVHTFIDKGYLRLLKDHRFQIL